MDQANYFVRPNTVSTLAFNIPLFNFPLWTCAVVVSCCSLCSTLFSYIMARTGYIFM